MDFVAGIPLDSNINGLVVCVKKLTKFTRLIPCFVGKGALIAPEAAELFFAHVVWFFGIPRELVQDQDLRLISTIWKLLFAIVGTRLRFSSKFCL